MGGLGMTGKVRFGIIGTGVIAALHAEAIRALENAELVAVYDKVAERCCAFAEKYHIQAVNDFDAFLSDKTIDAVTIATPTGLHAEVAIPAARAGKHVLCEKPLDVTLEKADAIIQECKKHGVVLSAVFQSRFAKNIQLLKKTVDEGRFGKIVLVSAQVKLFRSQEYYDSAAWRGTWALDGGGALMNQSIHTIDLLLYINGDPDEVFAYTGTLTHERIEVEDNACAVVKYKNGSMGVIEVSTSCAPGFPRRIEVSGSKGSVVMEDDQIVRWQFVDEQPEDAAIRSNGTISEGMKGGYGDPMDGVSHEGHRRQLADMVEAILMHKDPLLPGCEGRRAVQLICGIYESARTGKPVKF